MANIKVIKGTIVQSTNDEIIEVSVPTGLGIQDQKTVWQINELIVQWDGMENIPSRDKQNLYGNVTLSRMTKEHKFLDNALMAMIDWTCLQAGGATGGMTYVDAIKRFVFPDKPAVANSNLYIQVKTNSLAKNTFNYRIYYEELKVTELEFLKLQSGYCVC